MHEQNFRAVREALLRRQPHSRTLCYLGDHVSGYVPDERELRLQWRHFMDREFCEFTGAFDRIFHIPGNHDVYSAASHGLYEQVLPQRHANVVARKELNYAVRDGDALLVFLNTANPRNHGHAILDIAWLEEALAKGRDATIKLVFGHHPILPVNGYDLHPDWRVSPEDGEIA
ncbi:metallophosphoesterase, partial [Bradyrhizobium sp.]|uniref:metallophosphoesterase family protein n=1 Tax=Bradyrhizobium sp. TaxID=376 RepID=UPI0025BA9AEA